MSNPKFESEILDRLETLNQHMSDLSRQMSSLKKEVEILQLCSADLSLYGRLQELLSTGQWREADLETTQVMLEVAGQESNETLLPKFVQNFPCSAIRVIDQLWSKYSDGRFGFSIKLKIYQEIGGTIDTLRTQDKKYLHLFREKVGLVQQHQGEQLNWDEREISASSLPGSLPFHWFCSPYGNKMICFFTMRLMACGLDED